MSFGAHTEGCIMTGKAIVTKWLLLLVVC
jgi:hypothetical protein